MSHIRNTVLALGLLLVVATPVLITSPYWLHVINLSGIYAVVAIGLNILTGYTGMLSVGQAGFFGIGAYLSALAMLRLGLSFWLAMPLAALGTCLFGILMGLPAMRLKGPYLVMATVGFAEIVRLVLINWVPVTRGTAGLLNIPAPAAFGYEVAGETGWFYLIFALLGLVIFLTRRMEHSKIGRALRAVRENELAAEAMGVPVFWYKALAFGLSALLAGMAGSLFASFQTYISPDSFTFEESVAFVSMIVVGGIGTLPGAVVGALLMGLVPELLRAFKDYRLITYGFILLGSAVFFPRGIVGLLEAWILGKREEGASWLRYLRRKA
ncbi:MAG: branched-chain amino acid ABC transporter permease [Bacillota bacterium]